MNASISNRLARLEAKAPDPVKDAGWVRIIMRNGEDREAVLARHLAEHPEARGKNISLRIIV
jgi:hypothetical protein